MSRRLTRLVVLAGVLAALVLAEAPLVLAQQDCRSGVKGTLERTERGKEFTTYSWKVDVSTREPCATVYFSVLVTERTLEGEEKTVPIRKERKLRDTSTSMKIHYKMSSRNKMVQWEARVTECELCER